MVVKSIFQKFGISDSRSSNTLNQVILNFVFRIGTIFCSFLTVPLTLNYLDESNYGVWLTLNSIVGWFSFFDVGLGNGLKNRLSQTFVENDSQKARVLISTTYFLLALLLGVIMLVYVALSPFLDWNFFLNAPNLDSNLNLIAFVTIFSFCGRLLAELIFSLLSADQKTGYVSLLGFISSFLIIVAIFVLTNTIAPSLIAVACVFSITPLLVSLFSNFYFYSTTYRSLSPSWGSVKPEEGKKILNLGLRFFLVQIAVLIIYSTDNIIITHLYGPSAVTDYNVVYKYFSVVTVLWNITLVPYWTAFSNAYFSNDFEWVSKTMQRLTKVWLMVAVVIVILLMLSPALLKLWLQKDLHISYTLSGSMALFVLIGTFSSLYVTFINATGKIYVQLIASVIIAIINIPLSVGLSKMLNLGPAGVVIANCLCLSAGPFLNYIQYRKIVTQTDKGVWVK
jgi:O-antigen/teichoic acid export membrane protein